MSRIAGLMVALLPFLASAQLIPEVRQATAAGDFAWAERRIGQTRTATGVSPEVLEAWSWLARGAWQKRKADLAEKYSVDAEKSILDYLKSGHKLDDDRHTALALGAVLEVQAQVLGARGERSAAVALLNRSLATWGRTSVRTRLQKNLNLLTLEGRPAPPITATEWLGSKPPALATLRGKPVLLFFWAHWCGDCKAEIPILARLQSEFAGAGLVVLGPTQRYGYVAGGEDAPPDRELKYIEEVRRQFYAAALAKMPVPVSSAAFQRYGASTTPTIVLIDRAGVIRLYHPGAMTYEELAGRVRRL